MNCKPQFTGMIEYYMHRCQAVLFLPEGNKEEQLGNATNGNMCYFFCQLKGDFSLALKRPLSSQASSAKILRGVSPCSKASWVW